MGFAIVFLAVALNGAHFIINLLPDKNQFVAAVATDLLHQPVSIKKARLEGNASHPLLILNDVKLGRQRLGEIQVGVNLWRSLWDWAWVTDHVVVSDLQLSNQMMTPKSSEQSYLINWVMSQPDIFFQRVNLEWQTTHHTLLQIQHLTFQAQKL